MIGDEWQTHVECTQPFRKDFYVEMVYDLYETPKCVYGIYLTQCHMACNLQTLKNPSSPD